MPKSSSLRVDQQAAQLRGGPVVLVAHQEDTTHPLAVCLSYPEPFAGGIVSRQRSARTKSRPALRTPRSIRIPPRTACRGVRWPTPRLRCGAAVSGSAAHLCAVRPTGEFSTARRAASRRPRSAAGSGRKQLSDRALRLAVEIQEYLSPLRGEREFRTARILGGALPRDQPAAARNPEVSG